MRGDAPCNTQGGDARKSLQTHCRVLQWAPFGAHRAGVLLVVVIVGDQTARRQNRHEAHHARYKGCSETPGSPLN